MLGRWKVPWFLRLLLLLLLPLLLLLLLPLLPVSSLDWLVEGLRFNADWDKFTGLCDESEDDECGSKRGLFTTENGCDFGSSFDSDRTIGVFVIILSFAIKSELVGAAKLNPALIGSLSLGLSFDSHSSGTDSFLEDGMSPGKKSSAGKLLLGLGGPKYGVSVVHASVGLWESGLLKGSVGGSNEQRSDGEDGRIF